MRLTGEKALARAGWLLAVVWIGLGAGMLAQAKAAPAATKAAPANTICIADASPPIPAETALNKKEYSTAESLFRGLLEKSPGNEAAHEGLIRTLIGQDKVAAAAIDAEAWAAAVPGSSMAWTALGDVRFRQGEPREAIHQYQVAIQLNLCNARDYYGLARVDGLAGFNATRKRLVEQAYAIHPTDDDIYRAWMATRERKEWLEKWTDYSENSDQIGDEDKKTLKTVLEDEAQYPGADCRMTATSAREATVPMIQTIDGPLHYEGWGLDMRFNGKVRRVEISSRSNGITISGEAAVALGFEGADSLPTLAVDRNNVLKTTVLLVASIKIGGMEFTNCRVKVLPRGTAHGDGFIGTDVFQGSLVTLDFPKHELRLVPLPERAGESEAGPTRLNSAGDELVEAHDPYVAPEMAKWLRIYGNSSALLVATSIVDTSRMKDQAAWKDKLFVLGAGSESLISRAAAAEVTKLSPYPTTMSGFVENQISAREAGPFSMAFGGLILSASGMIANDLTQVSHAAGVEVSGWIGMPELTKVVLHIDYRDNLMWCESAPQQ